MPLSGKTVLVTRNESPDGKLTQLLLQHQATVRNLPTIELLAPASWDAFDAVAARLPEVDWICFTSPAAVSWTLTRLRELGRPLPETVSIAAVGSETGQELEAAGSPPALVPEHYQGHSLAEALRLRAPASATCWLPQSEIALPRLRDALTDQGFTVWSTPAYANHRRPPDATELEQLVASGLDWVTFASPSAAQAFFASGYFARQPVPLLRYACIGETTAQALRDQGITPQAVGDPQTLAGMVAAIVHAEQSR